MGNSWGLIRFGIGSRTSKDGEQDAVHGTPGRPGTQQGQEIIGRYYPWGYDSRSPTDGKCVLVSPNGGSQAVKIGERNPKAQPDYDDENWTVIMHNEVQGTYVKLRKDGGVQVAGKDSLFELKSDGTAKWSSASGAAIEMKAKGVISLNGGTSHVIREGDGVNRNLAMAAWMKSVGAATGVGDLPTDRFGFTTDGNPKVDA